MMAAGGWMANAAAVDELPAEAVVEGTVHEDSGPTLASLRRGIKSLLKEVIAAELDQSVQRSSPRAQRTDSSNADAKVSQFQKDFAKWKAQKEALTKSSEDIAQADVPKTDDEIVQAAHVQIQSVRNQVDEVVATLRARSASSSSPRVRVQLNAAEQLSRDVLGTFGGPSATVEVRLSQEMSAVKLADDLRRQCSEERQIAADAIAGRVQAEAEAAAANAAAQDANDRLRSAAVGAAAARKALLTAQAVVDVVSSRHAMELDEAGTKDDTISFVQRSFEQAEHAISSELTPLAMDTPVREFGESTVISSVPDDAQEAAGDNRYSISPSDHVESMESPEEYGLAEVKAIAEELAELGRDAERTTVSKVGAPPQLERTSSPPISSRDAVMREQQLMDELVADERAAAQARKGKTTQPALPRSKPKKVPKPAKKGRKAMQEQDQQPAVTKPKAVPKVATTKRTLQALPEPQPGTSPKLALEVELPTPKWSEQSVPESTSRPEHEPTNVANYRPELNPEPKLEPQLEAEPALRRFGNPRDASHVVAAPKPVQVPPPSDVKAIEDSIAAHVLEVKDLQEQAYARGKMSMVEHARAQQLGETIKTLAEQLAASGLIAARREPASQRTRSSVELGKRAGSASDLSRSHSEQKVRTGFERLEQQIAAAVALDEKQEQSQRVSEGIPPPDAVRAIATATAMGGNSNSSSSSTWTMAQGETPQPRPQLPVAAGYVRSPRRQAYDNQASASVVDGTSLPAVSTPAQFPTVSLDTWEIVSEDEEEDTLELDGEW